MIELEFSGNHLTINSNCVVDLTYPIKDAFESSGVVVVFLDPDANPDKSAKYKNLLGFNQHGKKIWEADLPNSISADMYWRVKQKSPLIVSSFSSYECRIDELTGKIKSSKFYK